MVAIKDISLTWWHEVYRKVKDASVFIDNPSAECLHWTGGVMDMLKAGATSVKEFSSFENGSTKDTKAVVIISSPVIGAVRTVLKDIVSNSYFEHCTLIIGCSPSVQTFAQTRTVSDPSDEVTTFQKLKQDVLIWMGTKESVVDILCYPIFIAPITKSVFVTPPFRELFPLIKEDSAEQRLLVSHKGSELENVPPNMHISVFNLINSLHSLLTQLDMREDVYSIGHLSGAVASGLLTHSQSVVRRKRASNKMTVILIDRTLDFGHASSYSSESLFDRILAVLPHLPGHTNDVSINMSPICTSKNYQCDSVMKEKQLQILIFLILPPNQYVSYLIGIGEGLFDPFRGAVPLLRNTEEGEQHLKMCLNKKQTLGVTEAMKSTVNPAIELTMSIEKLLLQTMAADNGTSGAVAQIQKLLKCRHEHGITVIMLLCIIIQLYSIVGTQFAFTPDDEAILQEEITNALYADRSLDPLDTYFNINANSEVEEIGILGRNIMNVLHAVGSARSCMDKYRYLLKNEGPLHPLVYNSLIEQLLADLVNPAKPDIPDLVSKTSRTSFGHSTVQLKTTKQDAILIAENKSDSLQFKRIVDERSSQVVAIKIKIPQSFHDLAVSPIRLLLNATHHPLDNNNILVFIVGGITAQECQQILNALESTGKQVLVGSTRLVSPSDTLQLLFRKDCQI